jgi:uncharacterized membrane protein
LRDRVDDATGHLTDITNGDAAPGMKAALGGAKDLAQGKSPAKSIAGAGLSAVKEKVKNMFGKGGGGGGKKKITNIVESIDVGVPVKLAYNQWTQFTDFPSFMKKVESVEQADDDKVNFKAQVFWSHRTWESTILEQQPDDKIVWRSKGAKGYVDGAVTFHELAPNLTRVLVVLEYHPQGLFEHTGNMWRAQGRRVRLELKHYRRHVMTEAILHSDEVEGWRGRISDGEVTPPGENGNGGRGRRTQSNGSSGSRSRSTKKDDSSGNGRRRSAASSARTTTGGRGSSSAGSRGSSSTGSSSRGSTSRGSGTRSTSRSSGSSGNSKSSGSSGGRSARSQSGGSSSGTRSRSRQTASRSTRSGDSS